MCQENCAICLEPPENPPTLQCGHLFCRTCLVKMKDHCTTSVAKLCPLCRGPIPDELLLEIEEKLWIPPQENSAPRTSYETEEVQWEVTPQENISPWHWLVSFNITIFFMKVFSTSCELDRSLNMLLYYEVYSIFHVALFASIITVVFALMGQLVYRVELVYRRHNAQPPVFNESMV